MDWKTVEILGYTHFAKDGYRILISLVDNHCYDFVAEKDCKFIRVNVKVAGLRDKKEPDSWSISKAGRGSDLPDVFLVWLPDRELFIELPGDVWGERTSKIVRIPKQYLEA